jgi:hypothetical protein
VPGSQTGTATTGNSIKSIPYPIERVTLPECQKLKNAKLIELIELAGRQANHSVSNPLILFG